MLLYLVYSKRKLHFSFYMALYLHTVATDHRLTCRPSQGHSGRTSPAQAPAHCRFPLPRVLIPPLAAATGARSRLLSGSIAPQPQEGEGSRRSLASAALTASFLTRYLAGGREAVFWDGGCSSLCSFA